MATDVYDLVQRSLAKNQGTGRNQFYDPTADFAMTIPAMIERNRDAELVADKAALTDMEPLIQSSNNAHSLRNVQNMINEFDPSNKSLEPAKQHLQNLVTVPQ